MAVSIQIGDANQPEVCALLQAGHGLMAALIPDRARKELSTEAIQAATLTLYNAPQTLL